MTTPRLLEMARSVQARLRDLDALVQHLVERCEALEAAANKPLPTPGRAVRQSHGSQPVTYDYFGRQMTRRELAALAGCATPTMTQRLRRMSAEQAVELGCDARGVGQRGPAVAVKPAAAPTTKAAAVRLDSETPVIVPPGVKITIAPAPRGRYEVEPGGVGTFELLGPGRYIEEGPAA